MNSKISMLINRVLYKFGLMKVSRAKTITVKLAEKMEEKITGWVVEDFGVNLRPDHTEQTASAVADNFDRLAKSPYDVFELRYDDE